MKILFTWHAAVETEYRKIFKEISKRGHELLVVCPKEWTEGGRLQQADSSDEDGYRLIALPVIFRNRIKGFFYPKIYVLYKLINNFKPDIFHIFEEPYSLSCFQMAGLSKIASPFSKIVVQSFENMIIAQRFPFSFIERFVLNNTDLLIAIPKEGELIWRSKGYPKTIKQVSVGLDENLFKKTEGLLSHYDFLNKKGRVRIAYIGRLSHEKGVSLLIEAVSNLLRKSIDCEFLIIGNGEREEFKNLAVKLGIGNNVVFMDAIPNYNLPVVYSKIDILVLPSITTTGWKEQFGRVLIEAMACEVAVIGSSSGEIPNVVGDAGIIFKEGDVKMLTEVLMRLILDDSLRNTLGVTGRKRVLENFTWERVAERLIKEYSVI
jgi:glycosyltransferase involved in cell wall biosynthesis